MNAHRRSPARPCHETSALSSCSPAIDFTGYRHSPATRPTTVMTASTDSKAPLPVQWSAERGGGDPSQRLSTPFTMPYAGGATPPRVIAVRYVGPDGGPRLCEETRHVTLHR